MDQQSTKNMPSTNKTRTDLTSSGKKRISELESNQKTADSKNKLLCRSLNVLTFYEQ